MNTAYALLARYETPTVQLRAISEEFFGLMPKTAEQKAKVDALPITTFKLRDSVQAPTMVHLTDLAAFIDKQRLEAKKGWEIMQAAKGA
ncbi:pyocin activator PrtN family protein [Shewanella surugensis]|uniref:Pyocin activator PrtN family protein n=1 Tax=Shewanella surugensis TaxID=212020 RepID=A0ABT0L6M0_9GAMM|nr:pyocin activator PrtN family protein [Shewanella surugensis]MCL1123333.1 pyocin activator PrtN family protein [Shewanella surugensis]